MSPKKRAKTKRSHGHSSSSAATDTPAHTAEPSTDTDDEQAPIGSLSGLRVSRTPVVVEQRVRWPIAVWSLLTLIWALGTPMFLVFILAEGFWVQTQAEVPQESVTALRGYLVAMIVCALAAPLTGIGLALWLRRRLAAAMFGFALLASLALGIWLTLLGQG